MQGIPVTPPGAERTPRWKARALTIAVVVFLLGVPALVLSRILGAGSAESAFPGEQPGGLLCGSVHAAEDGAPLAGLSVEFSLAHFDAPQEDGDSAAQLAPPLERPWRELRTDAGGGFEMELPPHDGFYIVRAGGELYAERTHWFSFLNRTRKPRASVPPLRLELQRGGRVVVRIRGANPTVTPRGHLALRRPPGFFGFGGDGVLFETEFEGARVETPTLPVQPLQLQITLETGELYSQWVELAPGTHPLDVDFSAAEEPLNPDEESRPDPSPAPPDRSP